MTTQKADCTNCNGRGAEGYEDAPGCYSWGSVCRACNGAGQVDEECDVCGGCAKLVSVDDLTGGADGKYRCAPCHLRADVKLLCRERPALSPSVANLYAASWATIARAGR